MTADPGATHPETASRVHWLSGGTVALAGLLLCYLLLSAQRSELKPLWFDELGTLNVASQPTLGQMFRVEPGDGTPPLQYFLVRASLHLPGTTEFTLRFPALLFELLAMICAYVFVGRRFGPAAGLVGVALLVVSRPGDYGVEARPYGLLLGLLMLLLVLWQRAAEKQEKRGTLLAGLALTVFATVIVHSLGVFWVVVPLGAAETYRWWRTRQLDKPVLVAVLLGLSGLAVTMYSGRATQQVLVAAAGNRHPAVSLPTLHNMHQALREEGFLPALALLLAVSGLSWWSHRRDGNTATRAIRRNARPASRETIPLPALAPVYEWVAVSAMVLTLCVVYLFTLGVTHYFWPRYLMPGVLASFLLLGMVCGTFRNRWAAPAVLVAGLALSVQARRQFVREQPVWPREPPVPVLLSQNASTEPILIGSPVLYSQIWWYSQPALRPRIRYIADAQHAVAGDDFVGDLTLLAMHNAGSQLFPPDDLHGFLAQNGSFLFWKSRIDNGDWVEGYLRRNRYTFAPVARNASGETLFQVSAPELALAAVAK